MNNGNEQAIDWISPCPVKNCPNKKKYYRWTHQQCGGTLLLSVNGEFICNKCKTKKLFKDWFFHCGSHGPEETSQQGASEALDSLSKLIVKKNKEKIISQLIKAVLNQFQESSTSNINNNSSIEITEIDFITTCPVYDCRSSGTEMYTWKHPSSSSGNCNGKLKVTDNGIIKCTQCAKSWDLVNWEFECPNHIGKQKPSAQGLCKAFSSKSRDDPSLGRFTAKCITVIMAKIAGG
jgi:hypothetical protein